MPTLPELHAATNGHPALAYALARRIRLGETLTEALDHAHRHGWTTGPRKLTDHQRHQLADLLGAHHTDQLTLPGL